jgi:hypothetical protein
MWFLRRDAPPGTDLHALELTAERAGCALVCSFASSAEYEAAIIKDKREAGAYGPKRQRRQILLAISALAFSAFSLAQLF